MSLSATDRPLLPSHTDLDDSTVSCDLCDGIFERDPKAGGSFLSHVLESHSEFAEAIAIAQTDSEDALGRVIQQKVLPLSCVENEHFLSFVGHLNPLIVTPSRRRLSDIIIPRLVDEPKPSSEDANLVEEEGEKKTRKRKASTKATPKKKTK